MAIYDFDEIFKWTKLALSFSAIETETSKITYLKHLLFQFLFTCNFIVLHSVIFGEIAWVINGLLTGRPFVEISLNAPCITMSILSTVKAASIYSNEEILERVILKLKEINPEETIDNEIKNKITADSLHLIKSIIYWLLVLYMIVFFMFCFLPLLVMVYHYYDTTEFLIIYPFQVQYFFFDVNTKWWPLIYFHQLVATFVASDNLFSCESLYYVLCVYLNMHFRLLGIDLENAITPSKQETKKKLATSIKRHQELIELVQQTEVLFSKPALFSFVTSSILICLAAFNITEAEDVSTIIAFITFLMLSLSQISLLCYFADLLMRSSSEISASIYKSQWYTSDVDVKRTVFLIIIRAQRACQLTAYNFSNLSLMTFTTVLSRSWSYFALLKSYK